MADLDKTIQVAINGEDNISKKLQDIDKKLDKFGSSLEGVVTAAGKVATAIATISTAITGAFAVGLVEAYQEAANFEDAMLDLEKVVGDQPEKLEGAKQAAKDLAVEYGKSAEDIVGSITNWKQAGYDVEEATEIVNDQLDLMVAGDMEAKEATDALTKAMKGFNLEAEESQKVVDTINSISNEYATSSQKLADALGKVAPTADQMNLSLEDMAGLMTPVIEDFQNGKEAGNAFEKILLRMKDDAKPVQEAFEAMGLEDFNRQMASGEEIIMKVADNFQDLNKGQKTFVAQQIAGKEHSGKFLSVMNDFPTALGATETAMNSAGSATKEADKKLQGAKSTMNQVEEAASLLAETFGSQYLESGTGALEGFKEVLVAVQEAIGEGAMEEFFKDIRDLSEELETYLKEVADVMPKAMESVDWSVLGDSVRNVADSFQAWFDGLDLTTVEGLSGAIQKLVDTLSAAMDTFAAFNTILEGAWDAWRVFWNAIVSALSETAEMVIAPIEAIISALSSIPGTGEALDNAAKSLENLKESLGKETQENVKETKKAFADLVGQTKELPEKKETEVKVDDKGSAKETGKEIDKATPEKKDVKVNVDDMDSAPKVAQKIKDITDKKETKVNVDDKGTAKETKDKIKDIPKEKKMEVKAELKKKKLEVEAEVQSKQIEKDIAKIETKAETAQEAMKMTAEVKTAQAEASMEKFKASMEGVSSTIKSISEAQSSMASAMGNVDWKEQRDLLNLMEDENELKERSIEKQNELIDAQIKTMEAKRTAMESGEGMINIKSEGLEPELEAFMWKILEKVQVRANEEASEFLLGINS